MENMQAKQTARKNVELKLANLEQHIHDLETKYLDETATTGNVLAGFGNYLKKVPEKVGQGHRSQYKRKFKEEERMFSRSSCTAPGSMLPSVISPPPPMTATCTSLWMWI